MSKRTQFSARATNHGQTLSVQAFSGWPSGTFVDAYSGEPDPDAATYPAAIPEPSYATARTVQGFLQTNGKFRDTYVRAPWGEDVQVDAIAYIPGAESISQLDKITYSGNVYYVIMIADWFEANERVHWELRLSRKIARSV